jgi:NAD(P)-dependent dehydrogenase (short-subunit alcohol dehydrogenase family)
MKGLIDLFDLSGQVAIVTGGGKGIGLAISKGLATAGAIVVIGDILSEVGEVAASTLQKQGVQAKFIQVDVTKRTSVEQLVSKTMEVFHRIDILVNNAGVIIRKPIEEVTDKEWDWMMDVNLRGTFLCSQIVGREMIKRKYGKIINISSNVAHTLQPHRGVYAVTKAGISHLTRAFALDWAPYHIHVNAIAPGTTTTELNRRYFEEHPDDYQERIKTHPLGRLGVPEDYIGAALLLATKASDFMTGQTIFVDGGSTLV